MNDKEKFLEEYRKFPDKFIVDVLNIPLNDFQRILIREIFANNSRDELLSDYFNPNNFKKHFSNTLPMYCCACNELKHVYYITQDKEVFCENCLAKHDFNTPTSDDELIEKIKKGETITNKHIKEMCCEGLRTVQEGLVILTHCKKCNRKLNP